MTTKRRINYGTDRYVEVVSPSIRVEKLVTFTGAAGLGATGAVALFGLTGKVVVDAIMGVVETDLVSAGGGTLALGVTGATTQFIAATTATDLDIDELWLSTTPQANALAVPAALQNIAIAKDIIGTVGTAAISAGAIRVVVWYTPITSDGELAAAA